MNKSKKKAPILRLAFPGAPCYNQTKEKHCRLSRRKTASPGGSGYFGKKERSACVLAGTAPS